MDDKSIHHHFTIHAKSVAFSTGDGMKTAITHKREQSVDPKSVPQESPLSSLQLPEKLAEILMKQLKNVPGLAPKVKEQIDHTTPKGGQNLTRKTQLGRLLTHSETVTALHYNGEFLQALGVNEGLKKFNPSQRDLAFKIHYCLCLMLCRREPQARELFETIVKLVEGIGETYQSVLLLAENAVQLEKHFDAIMLCMIAARMADMDNLSISESAQKLKCMAVLREAAGNLSSQTEQAKPFIRRYGVEAVRPLFEGVMKTETNEKNNLIELKIATFHCMEIIQLYADDDANRAKTIERALAYLTEAYGTSFYSRKWFGNFSHNLGITYLKLSRPGEAAAMLSQAFDVLSRAVDFDDDREKLDNMTKAQDMLKGPALGGLVVLDN